MHNMHFWNSRKLADELRSESVTSKDKMIYFIVLVALFAPSLEINLWESPETPFGLAMALMLGTLGISVYGALQCYKTNVCGDNSNFFERFFCLSVPLGIKLIVFKVLGSVLAVEVVSRLFGNAVSELGGATSTARVVENVTLLQFSVASFVSLLLLAWYFTQMNRHLRQINTNG